MKSAEEIQSEAVMQFVNATADHVLKSSIAVGKLASTQPFDIVGAIVRNLLHETAQPLPIDRKFTAEQLRAYDAIVAARDAYEREISGGVVVADTVGPS